ncbi:hypothetical protein D9M71_148560 [compost metagenome]
MANRRVSGLPRHTGEPLVNVFLLEGFADLRVGDRSGTFLGLPPGPRRLFQFECAPLANAALERVRKAAGVEHHALQSRWMQAGHRQLRMGRVGQTHAADSPVAPGLLDDPGEGVKTVFAFRGVFGEYAFGGVAPATILKDRHETLSGKTRGHGPAGDVLGVELFFRARGAALVVGRALYHHRPRACTIGWQVNIGREVDAVTQTDHLVTQQAHGGQCLFVQRSHIRTLWKPAPVPLRVDALELSNRWSLRPPATPSPARYRSGTTARCSAPTDPSRLVRWRAAPADRWRSG